MVYILQLDKDTGLAKEHGENGNGVGSIRLCKDYREGMNISEMNEDIQRQRMGICHAHPLRLYEDGRLECCSIVGEWKRLDDYTLEFVYGPVREYVHMEVGLDDDNNKTSVLLSGLTNKGICTWAKKR